MLCGVVVRAQDWGQVALGLDISGTTCCVTSGELLALSVSPSPHLLITVWHRLH